jgi:hypothetical protein
MKPPPVATEFRQQILQSAEHTPFRFDNGRCESTTLTLRGNNYEHAAAERLVDRLDTGRTVY